MLISLIAASLLLAQDPVGTAQVAAATQNMQDNAQARAAQADAEAQAPEEERRMVCRRVRSVGSNRSERVCTTRAEAQEMRQLSRDYVDRQNGNGQPGGMPTEHSLAGPGT